MKKTTVYLLLLWACSISLTAKAYNSIWTELDPYHVPSKGEQLVHPVNYKVYSLDNDFMKDFLFGLSDNIKQAGAIELPAPDGKYHEFAVWQYHMMEPGLERRHPDIRTFTAYAVDDPKVMAKIDYSLTGFHAMIYNGRNTYFIDPYSKLNDGNYICYYKRDHFVPLGQGMKCEFKDDDEELNGDALLRINNDGLPNLQYRTTNGYVLRNYRLALACTGEYAVAVAGANPTAAAVLPHMVTSINRVNGVYETELSIILTLIANEDTLIFLNGNTDPYTNNNGGTMLNQNQTTCSNRIGSANYDMGHVFSTGGGGIANLGCVCKNSSKAKGVTGSPNPIGDGFDIDYVAHEMGHQFGANHTFNNDINGSCNGNANQGTAYEPSSGTTIMAYAGICPPDDIQQHSDAYFHAASLKEISSYIISTPTIDNCPVKTNTNNKPVGIANFTASYTIPYKTPFELTAPIAVDSVADTLTTYCWEQWDLGDYGLSFANTHLAGPIFRSFSPDTNRTRIFPTISKVLAGILSYTGEKVPDTARSLTFINTIRAIYQGTGAVLIPDDNILLDAVSTGAANNYQGFKVTSPSTAVTWQGLSLQNITWNVVGTDAAPVSCDSVDVYLSVDGGYTWPYSLGRFVNNGSAAVTLPNPASTVTTSRIKVKGAGNVFFNVNGVNFTIAHATSVQQLALNDDIKVYPVPAGDQVHISTLVPHTFGLNISNTLGQQVWIGEMNDHTDIRVASWAKGVYYIRFTDKANGQQLTKQIIVK